MKLKQMIARVFWALAIALLGSFKLVILLITQYEQ